MGIFSKYPYTDYNNLNLDWIIERMREVERELQRYLENSVITFADPITWNITEQYTALTVVVDTDGTAYLSKQPVPAGVDISNTNYWLPIFNYDDNINTLRSQIAYNARTSNTTDVPLSANDLVFWNGVIYRVIVDMAAGTAFIEGSNVEEYTVDQKINDVVSSVASFESRIETVEDDITTINDDITSINDDITTINGDITSLQTDTAALEKRSDGLQQNLFTSGVITVKGEDDLIDGFPYAAFSGGCMFQGHELHAVRVAPQHNTVQGDYGKIAFFEMTPEGLKPFELQLSYNTSYGELRDPNLTASRFGDKLYISCFIVNDSVNSPHYRGVLFVFDKDFNQISTSYVDNTIFWGNTLETPSAHLLKCAYYGGDIFIYRSNELTTSDPASFTFTLVTTLQRDGAHSCAEPTIGYYRDRIVCIVRETAYSAARMSYTYDLEGSSAWTQLQRIESLICEAPAMIPYSSYRYLIFAGSLINANITGNNAKRMPYLYLLDLYYFDVPTIVTGGLYADRDTWGPYYGGYPSFVQIDSCTFASMYYRDTANGTTELFYRRFTVNEIIDNKYFDVFDVVPPIKLSAYDVAAGPYTTLCGLVTKMLNRNTKVIEFVITNNTGMSSFTDLPSTFTSNYGITGVARRDGEYYMMELMCWASANAVHKLYAAGYGNIYPSTIQVTP